MSSDESASTQISTISSQIGNEQRLKTHKSNQWEINLIGNFLLSLYHRLLITPQNNWMANKSDMRKEFKNFLTADLCKKIKEPNGTDNIGTLLHRCGFIVNTPRGSDFYQIKSLALFEFRNKKLKEQDNWRINNDINKTDENKDNEDNTLLNLVQKQANILLEENLEVDKGGLKNLLEYQGTTMQQRLPNYCPTNMSCFICQEDFSTMDGYEEHIIKHNDESDFEFLNTMSKFNSPIFTISYRLCKNSHYFCFNIETKTENLIIEKIIIVQSRSLYYVHNARVPYSMPDTLCEKFFVDCHLFTIYLEQPIVLVCHLKDNKETRIIEQHHFMRSTEFPKVNFAIKPYRLPSKKTFKPTFQLADYFPPKEIREALKDDFYNEKLMKASNEFRDYVRNEKKLQPQTIGPSLNILLQIEDLDILKQYFNLTQRNVKIRSFADGYSIKLRPKQRIFIENVLSICDELILTSSPNISTKPEDLIHLLLQNKDDILCMKNTFVGQIEDVDSGRISFKCYQKIDVKNTYTVICRPSRLNLRYQYRSLEMLPITMPFLMKFLFPAQIIPRPLSTLSLTLYNQSINGNPEQLQAVRNIAEGPRNDATYIIFGPPGTGKTTTIVEAILQVLKREGTKILVTASSNSACDEVALRLIKQLDSLDMSRAIVRIYSRSSERRVDNIDDELLEHSNMYNGQFYPDIEVLHAYRIVVCTLSVVAKLSTGKFGRRVNNGTLYTHLFIDEVAASMESETLVAITTILTPKSSLIIAGDHKQLGPILQSKRAEELGLGLSLMERLLDRECYRVNTDTGHYDRTIQTRLRLNFRSHPDIVNLYSGMYYNHDLEPKVNLDDVSLVKHWHLAQNKEYPIIFHCVNAPSRCDNQSPSLYNIQELNVVMDYVKDLMYFGINGNPVNETDIGIISPYKKQYIRIREELNLRKWFKIETGSVETFQGKEKQIIIVSFVRSDTRTLGFLENPRRLNVTISRAKSLLIMIGNPQTLSLNGDFAYIIKECERHKTIVGSVSSSRSIEKLNNNRREHYNSNTNKTRKEQTKSANLSNIKKINESMQKCNVNDNYIQSQDLSKMSALNESMQKLNVKDNSNQPRRRKRGGRARNRRNGSKSRNGKSLLDKNKENNNDNDLGDDDDDVSIADTNDGDNKPSTSKDAVKQNQNIRSREFNRRKENSGKITKQYNKGKQTSNKSSDSKQNQQKTKIESLFEELPKVPKISPTKDNENLVKTSHTTPVLQKAHIMQQQQQHQRPQYYSTQQQNFCMNNNMTNRPMNPTGINTQFGQYNHMTAQVTGANITYNGPYAHYPQQLQPQQPHNSYGYNQSMNYPQLSHISFQNHNMPLAFNAHNANAIHTNSTNNSTQKSSSLITESKADINKNLGNNKSSTENKTLKSDADQNSTILNTKMSKNNNSSSTTSSYAKINDQTSITKNLTNASKSSIDPYNTDNKTSKADGDIRQKSNTSNMNKSNNITSVKDSASRYSIATVNNQTAITKNLNSNNTDINKPVANNTKSSNEAHMRPNLNTLDKNTSNNDKSTDSASVKNAGSATAHHQSSYNTSASSIANFTIPTSANWRQNSTIAPSNTTTTSSNPSTTYNKSSTGAITKLPTSAHGRSSPIVTCNVRPIMRSTSTATPVNASIPSATSSGSALTHNSTNNPSVNYYSNSHNTIDRPVSNYSIVAPERHNPNNIHVYGESRRPVRNFQFDNQKPSPKRQTEDKKCIIS